MKAARSNTINTPAGPSAHAKDSESGVTDTRRTRAGNACWSRRFAGVAAQFGSSIRGDLLDAPLASHHIVSAGGAAWLCTTGFPPHQGRRSQWTQGASPPPAPRRVLRVDECPCEKLAGLFQPYTRTRAVVRSEMFLPRPRETSTAFGDTQW